jgi:hypothetical protein
MSDSPKFWSFAAEHDELISFMERVKIDSDSFNTIVELNNLRLVQLAVIKGGADINQLDKQGIPVGAYINLVLPEGKEIFKWLVDNGADVNNGDTITFFMAALSIGDRELIQVCLEHGAIVLPLNSSHPLDEAFTSDHTGEIFKELLTIAKKEVKNDNAKISELIFDSYRLLSSIASYATPEFIDWAVAQGLNVHAPITNRLSPPLQIAANRADDPQGKIFEKLMNADLPIDQVRPEILSKFLIKILDAGNTELYKLCLRKELTVDQRHHLVNSITKNHQANLLYAEYYAEYIK